MTVKSVNALFATGAVQAANQTGQAAKQDESVSTSFGQVMNKVNSSITNLKSELAGAAPTASQAGTGSQQARGLVGAPGQLQPQIHRGQGYLGLA